MLKTGARQAGAVERKRTLLENVLEFPHQQ